MSEGDQNRFLADYGALVEVGREEASHARADAACLVAALKELADAD